MQELQRKLMDNLRPNVTRVEMGRKASLLDQGDVSQKLFFVEAGCLRLYRVDEEGEDTTLFFFMEGEMVASFESFLQSEPSEFGIEAVAPAIVQCIEKQVFLNFSIKILSFALSHSICLSADWRPISVCFSTRSETVRKNAMKIW